MGRNDLARSGADSPSDEGYDTQEGERVLQWRLEQFTQLGFAASMALVLAYQHVDLALARKLVGDGCPPLTAAKILL
jgi:hypothetical protein